MPTICEIELDVECIPPINPASENGDRFEDCDSIALPECLEKVTLLEFRYDGGDCANSFNVQDPLIFVCEDYFGGPPAIDEIGAESLIIVTDIKGLGVNYFSGVVPIGGDFKVVGNPVSGDLLIPNNVNVTIYEGERASENIRQTMVIHTSCSQVTFLKDRYGALLLIAFENESQGLVDCFFDVMYTYSATSLYDFPTTVDTMASIFSGFPPPTNFTDYTPIVGGKPLPPGEKVFLVETDPIEIDLSVRTRYTVFTTIQAVLDVASGFTCRQPDFTNFTAGLADTRPTSAPSVQ